jgi:anti-sigma factor (TIGR02949 family)
VTQLTRFTCEDAFVRLDDYLDRELSETERQQVLEHLEICVICSSEFAFERSMIEGVKRKMRQLEIPADVLARLTSTIAQARCDPIDGADARGE